MAPNPPSAPESPTPHSEQLRTRFLYLLIIAAIAFGAATAWHRRWVCDDAFISYRYARNWVEGQGLVFNPGERVEGYSNFLWTISCAASLLLGIPCEPWTMTWGIIFYALSLAMLGRLTLMLRARPGASTLMIPIAAILGALHEDWAIFATSGLETSLFTFLAILGFMLLAQGVLRGRHRPVALGVVMTLECLTRPDGAVFAVVAGASLLWLTWPRWRPAAAYAAIIAIPQLALLLWRRAYYGDWLPNTFYAKSAELAWWEQGWHYLTLYLTKYAVVGLGIPALLVCLFLRKRGDSTGAAESIYKLACIAAAFGLSYTLAVTRLGGDFMFARMLIPATPFMLILTELAAVLLIPRRVALQSIVTAALAAGILLPPYPMSGILAIHGVANEWNFYNVVLHGIVTNEKDDRASATLKKYMAGLPVTVAFLGAEAHVMYRARIDTAIESEAGLTDRFIAHQALPERGRIGHEKNAPLDYLIRRRKAHFTFHPSAEEVLHLSNQLLTIEIDLDGLKGYLLHWDPAIMAELKRRGARFPDLPSLIDGSISQLASHSDEQVAGLYARLRLMYWEHVNDPGREAPFRKRLGLDK